MKNSSVGNPRRRARALKAPLAGSGGREGAPGGGAPTATGAAAESVAVASSSLGALLSGRGTRNARAANADTAEGLGTLGLRLTATYLLNHLFSKQESGYVSKELTGRHNGAPMLGPV